MVTPAPVTYNPDDTITKPSRYKANEILGYDVKCTKKAIRRTPGPAEYNTICHDTSTGVGRSAVKRITHNHSLNFRGGLKKPETISYRDRVLIKSFNF
jgi:hypothetical protein